MNPIIDGILMVEGGYSFNPQDSGGETNWGITQRTARACGYSGSMREMTRSEAYSILEQNYWIKPGFDLIAKVSWDIAFELCDAAVNIGPRLPCLWIQRWLNALNREQKGYRDIKVDGCIGLMTVNALEHFLQWRGREGERVLVKALNCSQGAYYLNITEEANKNEEFIYGWIKNRVA